MEVIKMAIIKMVFKTAIVVGTNRERTSNGEWVMVDTTTILFVCLLPTAHKVVAIIITTTTITERLMVQTLSILTVITTPITITKPTVTTLTPTISPITRENEFHSAILISEKSIIIKAH